MQWARPPERPASAFFWTQAPALIKHVFERIKNGPRGEFAVNYRTDAEQRRANEWRDDPVKLLRQEADRLAKAVAEAEVAQDQDRACEIALAALSR